MVLCGCSWRHTASDEINPAVTAAEHNDTVMLLYWLEKQKKIFADDADSIRLYLGALRHIDDRNLDARKKELRKTLNTR